MAELRIQKTNAARLLEAAGIPFRLIPYRVDESNLAADHVAAELGEPIEQVFKTLVLRGDRNGLFVCVMPGIWKWTCGSRRASPATNPARCSI